MDPTVRIIDSVYGWESCLYRIGTLRTTGLTKISFADEIEEALVWCQRRDGLPIGRTPGKYKPSPITASFLIEAWVGGTERFPLGVETNVLHDGAGSSGRTQAPMFLQYFEEGVGRPVSVVMQRCRLVKREFANDPDAEAKVVNATFQPIALSVNGISLFAPTRGLL